MGCERERGPMRRRRVARAHRLEQMEAGGLTDGERGPSGEEEGEHVREEGELSRSIG